MVADGEVKKITDKEHILDEIKMLDNSCRCLQACEIRGKSNAIECAR